MNLELLIMPITVACALALDRLLAEPRRYHPLIGFGRLAAITEAHCRQLLGLSVRIQGIVAVVVLVLPALLVCSLFSQLLASSYPGLVWLFELLILYLALGGESLKQHVMRVYWPLAQGDIEGAREQVSMMVSRNTQQMSETEICSAAVESVLENGNDAVIAAILWYLIAGAPGALLFRMLNTLDAMWGYKNPRYIDFGWCAARLDDVMGWLPARLTALLYLLLGNRKLAWRCWQQQAAQCKSPNGGVVMTSGAGALQVVIGGPAYYHGQREQKPFMGTGETVSPATLPQACRLVNRAAWLLTAGLFLLCGLCALCDGAF